MVVKQEIDNSKEFSGERFQLEDEEVSHGHKKEHSQSFIPWNELTKQGRPQQHCDEQQHDGSRSESHAARIH